MDDDGSGPERPARRARRPLSPRPPSKILHPPSRRCGCTPPAASAAGRGTSARWRRSAVWWWLPHGSLPVLSSGRDGGRARALRGQRWRRLRPLTATCRRGERFGREAPAGARPAAPPRCLFRRLVPVFLFELSMRAVVALPLICWHRALRELHACGGGANRAGKRERIWRGVMTRRVSWERAHSRGGLVGCPRSTAGRDATWPSARPAPQL